MSQSPARAARRHPRTDPVPPWVADLQRPPLDHPGVVVSWIHPGEVAGGFCDSLTGLLLYDASGPRRIVNNTRGGGTISLASGPRVAEARSQVVDGFLKDEAFTGAEYLLMLDADMTFDPNIVELLVETAEDNDADVVGGLCFAGGRSKIYPTIYRSWRDDDNELCVEPVEDYPLDTVVQVQATGGAAILIRRRTLLGMMLPHPDGYGTLPNGKINPYPWFVEGHVMGNGKPLGEDIAFCIRVNGLGGKILVDTRAKLGHVKPIVLDEDTWLATRTTTQEEDAPSPDVATPTSPDAAAVGA